MDKKSDYRLMTEATRKRYIERVRAWQARNPEKQREYWRRWKERRDVGKPPKVPADNYRSYEHKKLGLTKLGYDDLHRLQRGKCAICHLKPSLTNGLHVDHDHVTRKVRGLLCGRCNRGIGLLGDSIERLGEAAIYLLKQ